MDKKPKQCGSRKRGRPAGKHRTPLTLEERRARNAQYERERRVEMSDAFVNLGAAAGCDASISNSELLAMVVTQLQRASKVDHSTEMESLKRTNAYYLAQIADLEQRLAEPEDVCALSPGQDQIAQLPRAAKRKRSDSEESEVETVFQEPVLKSSPGPKYTSPSSLSSEPSPWPVSYSEQEKHSPEPKLRQHYFTAVPKYSPDVVHHSLDPWFPAQHSSTSTNLLPVPKVSPLTDTTDQLSPETGTFDYSEYIFASAQVRTPEYRIASATECIPAGSPSPQDPAFYEDPCWPQQSSSTLSPSQFVVPEAQYEEVVPASSASTLHYPDQYWVQQPVYEVPVMQPTIEFPVQENIFSSVEILPAPEDAVLPSVAGGEIGVGEPNLDFTSMSYNEIIAFFS